MIVTQSMSIKVKSSYPQLTNKNQEQRVKTDVLIIVLKQISSLPMQFIVVLIFCNVCQTRVGSQLASGGHGGEVYGCHKWRINGLWTMFFIIWTFFT